MTGETFTLIETIVIALIVTFFVNLVLEHFNISKQKTRILFIILLIVGLGVVVLLQAAQEFGIPRIPTSVSDPSQLLAIVSVIVSVITLIYGLISSFASIRNLKEQIKSKKYELKQLSNGASETTQNEQTVATLNLNIGETAKTTTKEVTVFSAQKSNTYKWGSGTRFYTEDAPPQRMYIIANVEIKNNASDSVFALPSDFSIVDHDGYKYDNVDRLTYNGLPLQELFSNQRSSGKVVFEVPVWALNLKLVYKFGWRSNIKFAYWRLLI